VRESTSVVAQPIKEKLISGNLQKGENRGKQSGEKKIHVRKTGGKTGLKFSTRTEIFGALARINLYFEFFASSAKSNFE